MSEPKGPEHTPSPWRIEFHPLRKGGPATLIMRKEAEAYDKWIAECHCGKDGSDRVDGDGKRDCTFAEAQANARFIVHASNEHEALAAKAALVDKLVAALTELVKAAEGLADQQAMPDDSYMPALDQARAVLAK